MAVPGYNIRKAAHVSAFFAQKNGGYINVLRLTKLVYLADREFMRLYDCPILFDQLVSMPHGPVNSLTLNYVNGLLQDAEWDKILRGRDGYDIALRAPININDDLDELSDAEIDVLEAIWQEHHWRNKYQLRDYTHDNCPEWEDPQGSSNPIPYSRVFKFLGKQNGDMLADAIAAERELIRIMK